MIMNDHHHRHRHHQQQLLPLQLLQQKQRQPYRIQSKLNMNRRVSPATRVGLYLTASVYLLLLVTNQLLIAAQQQQSTTTSKQTAANDTGGVDEILRDTFQLLDSFDKKLTQVSNRTRNVGAARSLEDVEQELLQASYQKAGAGNRSLVVPNLFSKIGNQQQAAQPAASVRSENDEQLTQMADQFSSVRKVAVPGEAGEPMVSSASHNQESQVALPSKKSSRQLLTSDDGQEPSQPLLPQHTNLGKFENTFTEKHIRFTLDMMRALFASHSNVVKAKPTLESFLISPVSVQLVLMMMHLGARGQTKRELSNSLHFLSSNGLVESTGGGGGGGGGNMTSKSAANKSARRNHQQAVAAAGLQKQSSVAKVGQTGSQQVLNNNVHEQFGAAMRQLLKDPTVVRALTSANQIFLQKDLPLSIQYEAAVKHYYGADLKLVDFQQQHEHSADQQNWTSAEHSSWSSGSNSSAQASIQQTINEWVERQTRGKISNFLTSPVPTSTLLMALNVLFYKGDWQYKFDPADTEPDAWFTQTDGRTTRVPMMVNKLPLAHAHDPIMKTSVIELPYKAQRLGLFILLPDEIDGIFNTMQMLNSSSLANLISMMRKPAAVGSQADPHGLNGGGINVRIPKFSIESSPRLSHILSQQLGLKTLFSPDVADLSGMFLVAGAQGAPPVPIQKRTSLATTNHSSPGPEMAPLHPAPPPQVGLDELLHKAVLQVHEQGSVAAAASATIVERVGLFNGQYFEADHPFLVFLMDKQTGLILFSGVYAGPAGDTGGHPSAGPQLAIVHPTAPSSNSTLSQADGHGSRAPSKVPA